jgi:hypothetical protein
MFRKKFQKPNNKIQTNINLQWPKFQTPENYYGFFVVWDFIFVIYSYFGACHLVFIFEIKGHLSFEYSITTGILISS